jgi:hypothetical protein
VIVATAISRPAFFPLSLLVLLLWPLFSWAALSLSLDSIRHPAFEADGIEVAMATGRRGDADIRVGRLATAGVEYRKLSLHCVGFVLDLRHIDCPQGEIRRDDERGADRLPLPISFSYRFADGDLAVAITGAEAVAWSPLIKRLRSWQPQGTVDLKLTADRHHASLNLTAHKLKFGNKAGDIAGDSIDLVLNADAERIKGDWRWKARVDWPTGELYVAPWYRRAGVTMEAQGVLTDDLLDIASARLAMDRIGGINASLRWNRHEGEAESFWLVSDALALETAFTEWIQPWLDQSAVPKVRATGQVRFSGAWSNGMWQSLYAGLEDARVVDGTSYLEFGGMNASIPWERGKSNEAEFSVASARLGDLPLGAFRIPVHLNDNEVQLKKLSVPLLDGRLYVDELHAVRNPEGWRGTFAGGMEGISMPKLTRSLKLPIMAGNFTANIPAAVYENHVLTLGGAMAIQVFDGGILVDKLQVIDPLSAGQRFVADVRARNLDLGMLTQAFSFGNILGRLDIDLTGLELDGWQPTRFDAKVTTSPGNYRRTISRGALIDISALGGAAGAVAVSLSPARFFNTFDYERIGFSCALRDSVCQFEGIEPAKGGGYVVVKGTGIPSVQVIGYNRRIDWNLFVSRVRAVVAGKSKAVIE